MEYFYKKNHFHLLKNYILKDPLSDWFNIQEYLKNEEYKKDESSHYKDYIIKESNRYKIDLLQKIKKLSNLDIPIETGINETKGKLLLNYPLILQGKLFHKLSNLYVKCDIIIRYDLFKKIFPHIGNIPFHLICKRDNYLLINISYATLHFKMDLKDINNNGLLLYKKCNLYAFRKAFYQLKEYKPACFILGKEYYYKKTLLPKNDFICYVTFSSIIKKKFYNALEWIKFLKDNFQNMKVKSEPTHHELYPNMNYKESNWENEKLKLANKIKEITLVWNISYDERCKFLEKGILCWDDPKLLNELKESKKKNIQERMIHMNQQNEVLIYPRKNISNKFHNILNKSEYNDIYFDVESFLTFDEKQDIFNEFIYPKEPVLGILGFIHNNNFYNYTIERFTLEKEEEIIKNFCSHLWKIKGNINIYHWGHAEYNYFKYIHETYPNIQFPEYTLINVLDYFRMEPIIVQGVFKFGLKSIGDSLYKNNLIRTTWGENDNGLDSMIQFKEICLNHAKNIPLKRYLKIHKIIEYNQIDCQVLYEIVELLRETYKK